MNLLHVDGQFQQFLSIASMIFRASYCSNNSLNLPPSKTFWNRRRFPIFSRPRTGHEGTIELNSTRP
jgi:hypothetical protein